MENVMKDLQYYNVLQTEQAENVLFGMIILRNTHKLLAVAKNLDKKQKSLNDLSCE